MKKLLPIRIVGTGAYVPDHVITNQHFVDYLDTSDEWIVSRTGIHERRRAGPDEYTSTLGARAARIAVEDAGLTLADIDLIICATATPDCLFPSTAAFIQRELGVSDVPAFDLGAACAGFLYATTVAAGLLDSGMHDNILVIGAETLNRFADEQDRTTAILFGDGAGAAVLSRSVRPDQGVLYWEWGTDGSRAEHIWFPAGGSRLYASQTTVAERLHYLHMRGREVFKFAVTKMKVLIDRALKECGLDADDLKLMIPHQSNLRIIESARRRLNLPREKVAINIDRFGNTSSASIIMSLDENLRSGKLQEGDHVLMVAIGAGLTWSSMVVRL